VVDIAFGALPPQQPPTPPGLRPPPPPPGRGQCVGIARGKPCRGPVLPRISPPDTGPWWLSPRGRGPPLSLARRYPHPPPRPRLRRSSPVPGAGAVRGDSWGKAVSGVALNPVLPRVCPDALDRSGLRTFDVRAPALRPVPYRIRGRGAGSPHKIIPVSPSGGPCMRIPGGNRAMGVCGWCCAA